MKDKMGAKSKDERSERKEMKREREKETKFDFRNGNWAEEYELDFEEDQDEEFEKAKKEIEHIKMEYLEKDLLNGKKERVVIEWEVEEVTEGEHGIVEDDDVPEITGKEVEKESKEENKDISKSIGDCKVSEEVRENVICRKESKEIIIEEEAKEIIEEATKTENIEDDKSLVITEIGKEVQESNVENEEEVIDQKSPKNVEICSQIAKQLTQTPSKPPSVSKEAIKVTLRPAVETNSSPLLPKAVQASLMTYGHSLDSKQVDETIESIEVDNIWKCLAFALLKHIEFSKGEVLIDDLVSEEEDIPQFSYEFGQDLRIDLEEIQQRKEMEKWEAQERNFQNFHNMQQVLKEGQPFDYQAYQHHFESNCMVNL
jgi:hypothetical protein